jgi:hypothetical protein
MFAPRWLVLTRLGPLWAAACVLGAPLAARAQDAESIDDPKLERRLGARVELEPAAAAPVPAGPAEGASAAWVAPLAPAVAEAPAGEVAASGPAPATESRTPRLKLGYRRFAFAQVPPQGKTGAGASEPFDVLSVDLYPISSTWRFGLTAQYGWQEGTFRQNGDAFFSAVTSLGWQIPGPALTPFFEGYAGGGLMQRTKSDLGLNTIATAFGELGFDVGTELFLARHLCLSFAVGYVHLTDGYARKTFDSFSVDTWSFKVGMGL